jgi:hypothetical protein
VTTDEKVPTRSTTGDIRRAPRHEFGGYRLLTLLSPQH